MDKLLFILLGMVAWQLITFVVLIISDENEEAIMRTGCGLPLLIINVVMFVLRFIRRLHIRKNYIVAHIYNEKGSDGKPVFISNVRVKKNTLYKYYTKGENQYYIEQFTPQGKCIENQDNIKKVRKNGWFCQEWINNNLVK